jgi:hypothetical protein
MLIHAFYRSVAGQNKPFHCKESGTAYFKYNMTANIFNQKMLA